VYDCGAAGAVTPRRARRPVGEGATAATIRRTRLQHSVGSVVGKLFGSSGHVQKFKNVSMAGQQQYKFDKFIEFSSF